jgi:hypothetical protein
MMKNLAIAVAAGFLTIGICGTVSAADGTLSGEQILARAAQADGLKNLDVPIHFDVHLRRPIGARAGVEGVATFVAPADAALQITKAPAPIGMFFRGTYDIDVVPQTWGARYRVSSMSVSVEDGANVYVLQALPIPATAEIDRVVFVVARANFAPLAAEWDYHNGSSIKLAFVDQAVGGRLLPRTATITVKMPGYALDARAIYGSYAFNVPAP